MGKLVKGTITLLNIKPFCIYKVGEPKQEVGIASGYFAGDKFAETEGNEYIDDVLGQSFGWYDSEGVYWKDNKFSFTRPTKDQIIRACVSSDVLAEIAVEMGLIEISKSDMERTAQTDAINNICLN